MGRWWKIEDEGSRARAARGLVFPALWPERVWFSAVIGNQVRNDAFGNCLLTADHRSSLTIRINVVCRAGRGARGDAPRAVGAMSLTVTGRAAGKIGCTGREQTKKTLITANLR